ncbi:hypothetical protein HRbin08_01202 [bacterium HR08]|nr:hypothetical protein HRbin08_01202 [bacterium HR08]
MVKKWLLTAFPALGISVIVGWISTGEPASEEPIRNTEVPARTLEPVFKADFVQEIELKGLKDKPVTIARVAADRRGNTYLLLWDWSTPKGRGCSIQKLAADGTLLDTIPLTGELWEPPVEAFDLAVGKEGTLYVAVNWPIHRGGLIAVDDSGNPLIKLTFRDFVPQRLTVDDHGHVWVLGEGISPIKAALEHNYIPSNPQEGEQLRVYSPDLTHAITLVRGEKEGLLPSTLTSNGDEIVYYASGTGTIRVFREDRLTRTVTLPKLTPLAPPAEVSPDRFKTDRFISGVYKIGDRFLVAGTYYYRPMTDNGGIPIGRSRTFIALVSEDGEAASPEFAPPGNVAIHGSSNGHLMAFSGTKAKGTTIVKLKPTL